MPTQKKFFVLSIRTPNMMEDLCIVVADSGQKVAELLVGHYDEIMKHKYYTGLITLSLETFRAHTSRGLLPEPKTLSKDFYDGRPLKFYLAEVPIIGRCNWHFLGAGQDVDPDCDEIGTLFSEEPKMLCPDAYRLLVDEDYKEDKKDK